MHHGWWHPNNGKSPTAHDTPQSLSASPTPAVTPRPYISVIWARNRTGECHQLYNSLQSHVGNDGVCRGSLTRHKLFAVRKNGWCRSNWKKYHLPRSDLSHTVTTVTHGKPMTNERNANCHVPQLQRLARFEPCFAFQFYGKVQNGPYYKYIGTADNNPHHSNYFE